MIDSFTGKIQGLQGVINDQRMSLDAKDNEILKLKGMISRL